MLCHLEIEDHYPISHEEHRSESEIDEDIEVVKHIF